MWRLRASLDRPQRTVRRTNKLKMELRGRRGAPGAMQRKRIARSCVLRERKMPGDELRRADQVKRGRRQRRHVQRLANMASRVRTLGMFVQEAAARREIQKRGASQQRHSSAHSCPSRHDSHQVHHTAIYLSTMLSAGRGRMLQNQHCGPHLP